MAVGLVKNGRWIAVLAVESAAARVWTPLEIDLLQETAKRALIAVDLARTLAEKDGFLREVRHRLMNTVQLIASLINLQANQIEARRLWASSHAGTATWR